jgi:uncharacterized membrane protein
MIPESPELPDPSSHELLTAISHLYRGEMNRMTVWRQRLDITSNWAIILATALTTFTLGSAEVPHYTLLLGLALIGISILIEGRRYRHLHHCKWRLYLLESGFFAEILRPRDPSIVKEDWRRLLAGDLRHTHFIISWMLATRVRLRRNYLLLLYFITAVWIVKLFIHPHRVTTFNEFWAHLSVGDIIPSWFVAATAVVFTGTATVLALTCQPAETLEDWSAHYARVRSRLQAQADEP